MGTLDYRARSILTFQNTKDVLMEVTESSIGTIAFDNIVIPSTALPLLHPASSTSPHA